MKFKVYFNDTYFRKGDLLHHNKVGKLIRVVKVYDQIWWRKLFIKWGWMRPTNAIKVTTSW